MRSLRAVLFLWFAVALPFAKADTTIVQGDELAWAANIGWVNFRPDQPLGADGAVIGETFCSGLIWSANCDWINLGDGSPTNGIRYSNTDGADFGVNHDGSGKLEGLAWGATIGWINFGRDYDSAIAPPTVDLLTGSLSGYAWSASCGWIDLGENGEHFVGTGAFGLIDTDGDSIDDGWERERLQAAGQPANLNLLGASPSSDADGDLQTDLEEYLADTNPFDRDDRFRIVSHQQDLAAMLSIISWTSSERRLYQLDRSGDLQSWTTAISLLGTSGADTTIAELSSDPATLIREFNRVVVKKPLQP